ncbi:MAG TPA: TonB-dependent receptor [Acidobacteriota bacterium]|nr:TonB-dependent receptor [Acidobacteriota bacterium]
MKSPRSIALPVFLVTGWAVLAAAPDLAAQDQTQDEKEKKARVRTEEIVVTAPAPQDRPLASTSVIPAAILTPLAPRNLSDVLSYAPGAYATSGGKGESHVKIRGLDADKSTLLIDGIPVYDPYFNTYDLKTVLTEDIESIKVVKGSSSVLYGPNTLGGIVDVLTLKPRTPSLTLRAAVGRDSNYIVSASGAAAWRKTIFMGAVTRDHASGLRVPTGDSTALLRNSDYGKTALTGKLYLYPGEKSEILAQASYYSSEWGIADATQYYKSRYWRFKDWRRLTLGLGGTFPLLAKGTLKVRTYYVRLDNTLDQYKNASMSALDWESIYKNYDAGAFILGSHPLGTRNELRFSLNARLDHVRQQGSATAPWETYEHRTYSAGIEDDFRLSDKWQLTGGFSVDRLKKQTGGSKTSLNPIAGVRFTPTPDLGFHLALSRKSRFPSMRSMYSPSSGNPALKDEIGTTVEAGAVWRGPFEGSLAVFTTEVEDLIYSVRLPSGYRTYVNIGKAAVKGFEAEVARSLGPFDARVSYTFLDTKNKDENRRLDLVPESQLSLVAGLGKADDYRFSLWGLAASSSELLLSGAMIATPGYVVANASFEKYFGAFSVYVKVDNLFDKAYLTEPGYPMASRRFEAGFRLRLEPKER